MRKKTKRIAYTFFWRSGKRASSQPKNVKIKRDPPPPLIFLSRHPPPSQSCPAEGTRGMSLLPSKRCQCLAQLAAGGRDKSQPQLDDAQKIFSKPPNFTANHLAETFLPPYPPCLSPVRFSPHFFGWLGHPWQGSRDARDAHGGARHDPGILPGLDLLRAGFQQWRSLSQILVDDRSGAFVIGSQCR